MALTNVKLEDKVELTVPAVGGDMLYIKRNSAGGGFSITDYKIRVSNLVSNYLSYANDGAVPTPTAGTSYYNTTTKQLRYYNGTVWAGFSGAFEVIDEGSGDGVVKIGRVAANFGDIGSLAFDISYSGTPSSTRGATGALSFAGGTQNIASGNSSFVHGSNNEASGANSIALGNGGIAQGNSSFVGGETGVIAKGKASFAYGDNVIAESYAETSIGTWSTTYVANSTTAHDVADRVFVVGVGTSSGARSDAFIILKSGHSEFGGTIRTKGYTVAGLPTGIEGDTAFVTDATAPTYLGALTGGGAVSCPVYKNATIWVSH